MTMLHQLREAPESDWQDATQQPEEVEVLVNALASKSASGPMTPQTTLEEKNVRPFGQVKWLAWRGSQAFSMFASAQSIVAICTKHDQIVAAICAVNVIRGGTFIY